MNQKLLVHIHHGLGCAFIQHDTLIQQNHPVTVFGHASQIMAYEQDCLSLLFKFFKFVIAFCLKKDVSHGQRLIHDQDFRVNVNGNRKGKPDKHTAGIHFNRLMDIVTDVRKGKDIIQSCVDLLF